MKNLKVNVRKMIGLRGLPLVLASTLVLTGLAGCSKKAECNIEGTHAHLYISRDGLQGYYISEELTHKGCERQDEFIPIAEEDVSLSKFLDKKGLVKLEDNLDVLFALQKQNQDYIEYEYTYQTTMVLMSGKTVIPMITTHWDYTTDPNHDSLTGETRNCHYVYQACNVMKDEHGEWVIIPSEEVDDIRDVMEGYTYIKRDYYKIIYSENSLEENNINNKEASEIGKEGPRLMKKR